jgi:hypothetical protein
MFYFNFFAPEAPKAGLCIYGEILFAPRRTQVSRGSSPRPDTPKECIAMLSILFFRTR